MKRSARKSKSFEEPPFEPPFLPELFASDDAVQLNPLEGNLQFFTSPPLKSRIDDFEIRARSIWYNAENYLFHNPPRGKKIVTNGDLANAINAETDEGLSFAQKNALHALRCIRELMELLHEGKPIYDDTAHVDLYPIGYEGGDDERKQIKQQIDELTPDEFYARLRAPLANVCGLVMQMVQAAMNIGFYGVLWPTVRRGAKQKRVLDERLRANKKRAALDEKKIVELAKKYKQKRIKGTWKMVSKHWLDGRSDSDKSSDTAPSYGKCQPIISALFKSLQGMKPPKKHRS